LSLSVSYFVVCYFQRKIFNTSKLLNYCKIDNEKLRNMILIITSHHLEHLRFTW